MRDYADQLADEDSARLEDRDRPGTWRYDGKARFKLVVWADDAEQADQMAWEAIQDVVQDYRFSIDDYYDFEQARANDNLWVIRFTTNLRGCSPEPDSALQDLIGVLNGLGVNHHHVMLIDCETAGEPAIERESYEEYK